MVKNNGREAGKVGVTVTINAIPAGRNVGRVNLGFLAGRHNTIVAGRTVISDRNDLVKDTASKGPSRAVAITTIQGGHQVAGRWFTGCRNTIVT